MALDANSLKINSKVSIAGTSKQGTIKGIEADNDGNIKVRVNIIADPKELTVLQ